MQARAVFLGALLVGLAAFVPSTTTAVTFNATFTDAQGVHPAQFSYDGSCNGSGTVTLTVFATGPVGETRTFSESVGSKMVPDLCTIACFDCPLPFVWLLRGNDVALDGGGVVPVATLAGTMAGGLVEVNPVQVGG